MIRLVRAELVKLRTTRTTTIVTAALAAYAGVVVFFTMTTAGEQGNPPLDADSLRQLLAGPSRVLYVAALLVGILVLAGEFRHQTITQAFLVTPTRGLVLTAKLATGALVGLLCAAVTTATTIAVGLPWLAAKAVPAPLSGTVGREVAGIVAAAALWGALGVAVAALVRNQVAAIVGALLWVLVVEGVLPLVLGAPALRRWLPGGAADALISPGGQHLSMWAGGLLLVGYAAVLAALGTRYAVRRDIT